MRSERNARKAPLTEEEVGRLLSSLEEVILVRGRAFEVRAASRTSPQDLRGPTGNFRAPLLRRGGKLLVGYQGEALERFLQG